jgi:two-component system cell cycle sensor histidine kinase/response regulator CckA
MTLTTFADNYLIPAANRHDRLSRLFVYLTLAATAAGVIAATMTLFYGHIGFAISIYMAALTLPLALALLHFSGSIYPAGHYLAGNLFLQTIFFAAEPAVGCVTLIALSAGVGLLGRTHGLTWLALVVGRCLYIAWVSDTEIESATGAVAGFISVVVFIVVRAGERSRVAASLRAKTSGQKSTSQIAVLQRLITEHFDALLQVDKGQITYVTPTLAKLLGYAPDEILSRPLSFFLHPDEKSADQLLSSAISVEREEIRLRHANGRWIWVEAFIAPDLQNQKAQLRHIILRNYDQQKRASEQLTQAQRLESMGNMAAAVAHDFNNMLTVILGFADELPDGTAKQEITRVTTNAASLTNKLMTFSHGHSASSEILDLSHVMREQSNLVRHALDSRYILIEGYQEDPALVRIDNSEFEQVFINLLNNAREAMPDGGEVEISLHTTELEATEARSAGTYAVVELRDSGCGMDEATQKRAFDPFFSTKESKKNSGLGLSSCYGIISQYSGFIDIESKVDHGTTVSVYLPIAETQAHEPVLELIDNDATVLVVDDDPGVLAVIKNALKRSGYQVRGFSEPEAAIEFFDRANICLLVTDVIMPNTSGADLAATLRSVDPDLPILYISGFTQDHLEHWQLGDTTMFLAKPFRGEEIIDRVESLLRAHIKPH